MQSRTRKILRCESDNEAIIRQLQNDFQVFEYLKQNKLQTINIEQYAKLFNSLIVESQQRKNIFNRIQSQYSLIKESNEQNERSAENRESILEMIQQKTGKQMQVSNQLEKQIIETKKSLNLLKGDIGHLVSRNQSAKLLNSKIAKVKIVAEDQLKRVTLAYIKDKQEIKLRNDMQKKFSKKLKNVSNYENSSLARLKQAYAEGMIKKQDIFEKLLASQKISENVQQAQMLKEIKTYKDYQNNQKIQFILHLAEVVKQFPISKLAEMRIDPNQIVQKISNYYMNLGKIDLNQQSSLIQQADIAVQEILHEYYKIQESIKHLSHIYQQLLNLRKEDQIKLKQYEQQLQELANKFSLEYQQIYKINENQQEIYRLKLKDFEHILNTLFVILSYLQKHAQFQTSYPLQYNLFTFKQEQPTNIRKSIIQEKQTSRFSFISCLSRVFHLLSTSMRYQKLKLSQSRHQQQLKEFYDSLLQNVKNWLNEIKKKFTKNYIDQILLQRKNRNSAIRYSIFGNTRRNTHVKKQSSSIQQNDEDIQDYEREEEINFITQNSSHNCSYTKSPSSSSLPQSQNEAIKAKRIQLLEGIDTDYYKMIKSTIKMQKQNTRKNYQFLRTFKRAKYASRDNILEQKRFQSSFSVLFTKQSVPNLVKTSKFDTPFNSKLFNQSFNNSSLFKKATNTGTTTPNHDGKSSFSKKQFDISIRKSRLTQKLKHAMQFV